MSTTDLRVKRKAQDDHYDISLFNSLAKKKTNTKWISGTSVANYLNSEPLLDWLNLYYKDHKFNVKQEEDDSDDELIIEDDENDQDNQDNQDNQEIVVIDEDEVIIISDNKVCIRKLVDSDQVNLANNPVNLINNQVNNPLLYNGLLFEDTIYNKLKDTYKNKFVKIANDANNLEQDYIKTLDAINKQIPIIAQAVILDKSTQLRGIIDLLVRSDYINKIFTRPVLDNKDIKHDNKLFYVVIDIKWTSMTLCADGKTIRNDGRFKSYKGQLLIYNYILSKVQNYFHNCAYIMSKNWKIDKKNDPKQGYSCFDLAGVINYSDKDNHFIKLTYDAINWVNHVRERGLDYSPLNPTITEMCVNASNHNDQPWHSVKSTILKHTKDITAVWRLTPTQRNRVFNKGIRSWDHKDCNTKNLGMTDNKISRTIDEILAINRENNKNNNSKLINKSINITSLKDIKDNRFDWKHKYPTDFYIDFETISEQLGKQDSMNITNSQAIHQLIFMIGVGYELNNKFHYKVFKLNSLSLKEEKRILKEFRKFISALKKDLDPTNKYISRLFHWSNAEKSMLENAFNRHKSLEKSWNKRHTEWIDLCDIFINEPIVVKGSLTFKLKDIANAMYSNELISTCWDTCEMTDGLSAMISGIEYYKKDNRTEEDEKKMNEIINYNKIDCKVLWDILKYIRSL